MMRKRKERKQTWSPVGVLLTCWICWHMTSQVPNVTEQVVHVLRYFRSNHLEAITLLQQNPSPNFSWLRTGVKQPTGKGSRLIIVDAGTKDRFIPGASLIFQAKKITGIITGRWTLHRMKRGSGNTYFLTFLPTAWLCWIMSRTIIHRLNCYHENTGERTWLESGSHWQTFNGTKTW